MIERQQKAVKSCPEEAARRLMEAARAQKVHSLQLVDSLAAKELTAGELERATLSLDRSEEYLDWAQELTDAVEPKAFLTAEFKPEKDLPEWRENINEGRRKIADQIKQREIILTKRPQARADLETDQLVRDLESPLSPEKQDELIQELRQTQEQLD